MATLGGKELIDFDPQMSLQSHADGSAHACGALCTVLNSCMLILIMDVVSFSFNSCSTNLNTMVSRSLPKLYLRSRTQITNCTF